MKRDQDRGPKQRQGGFTLIEVMVAIAILSFGILAVATMQTTAMRANYRGYRLTEAITLAQDRIEYLTTQPFDNLVEGDDQADPDPADPRPEITYDVEAIPGVATGWLITVKVQFQGQRDRQIKFIRIPLKGA
ncbi:MAG: prepilin-type N-terminal cleavage/methylation domain-containing protein [Deltaproteobacteria bacterium]|nr:prepilin-type N-terminal cleavage/methylation domain-containing protein [Deltaproteobacteria bacterium]